jgi:uncharacterized protein
MSDVVTIPLFPLSLLPLPGELVPLHIFEPRYRQLFDDLERLDLSFGIYCNHELNVNRIGAIMKLESVIKKYPDGESDVVVRCVDMFTMSRMLRTFRNKLYPAAEITHWRVDQEELAGPDLYAAFSDFQKKRRITRQFRVFSLYQIAIELNLDLFDRYKFITASSSRKLSFLHSQLKYQMHLLDQELKSKDQFFLN